MLIRLIEPDRALRDARDNLINGQLFEWPDGTPYTCRVTYDHQIGPDGHGEPSGEWCTAVFRPSVTTDTGIRLYRLEKIKPQTSLSCDFAG